MFSLQKKKQKSVDHGLDKSKDINPHLSMQENKTKTELLDVLAVLMIQSPLLLSKASLATHRDPV